MKSADNALSRLSANKRPREDESGPNDKEEENVNLRERAAELEEELNASKRKHE